MILVKDSKGGIILHNLWKISFFPLTMAMFEREKNPRRFVNWGPCTTDV